MTAHAPHLPSPWLARLPAGLFAIPLGLFALAGAWRRSAGFGWEIAPLAGAVLGVAALALLCVLLVLYGFKLLRHPHAVHTESLHALGGPSQALIPLALLMCAVYYGQPGQGGWLAYVLLALALQCVIALRIVGRLARGSLDPQSVTPALYLPPVAGGFVGAMALNALGYQGWGALLLGMGLASWALLEARVLHRLFESPLALPLRASIGVELAPPAVATLTVASLWPHLPGEVLIIGLGVSAGPLVAVMARWDWWTGTPFNAGFWSFSFPLAAWAAATVEVVRRGAWPDTVAAIAMLLVNGVYAFLLVRTAMLLVQGRLLPPAPVAHHAPHAPAAPGAGASSRP